MAFNIGCYTDLTDDTRKLLLQLVRNIQRALKNGMIYDANSLGIAAAHFREIGSFLDDDAAEYEWAERDTPEGDELSEFLQKVPKSWGENPWPGILHPRSTCGEVESTIKIESKMA